MLCLDLPHLEVKFKIVKEFTFPSQKKDAGGQRVRARENRGPEGYRGWELPMATTARVIWLCACVSHWPGRGYKKGA